MKTNFRQRLIILFAVAVLFALIYPVSRLFNSKAPPCNSILVRCRESGLHKPKERTHLRIYRDCIMQALEEGSVGGVKIPEVDVSECRKLMQRREERMDEQKPKDVDDE